jgi:arylformamidase
MTPDFVEKEYNNRALVPDYAAYFARWQRDSDYERSTLPCVLDLPYGPDPRHRLDLFPAASAVGTIVFIHGGYWRSLDKSMFAWLAAAWVASGVNFASINYRLCPAVRIDDIVEDAVAAVNWLDANAPAHGVAMERVVLSGHSAGGHLAAALFAQAPGRLSLDAGRIAGGAPLSGLFDFAPLRLFSFNADYHLDEAAVRRLSLLDKRPAIDAPLVVVAGGDESSEFRRQSRALADAWKPQVRALLLPPGVDHFTIVDGFAERGQPIFESIRGLLA